MPEDIDILKLSHHGAQNGGTELIHHTTPEVALIGVGQDNTYGHPHDDILAALGPNAEIRRTDLDDTFSVTFEQESNLYGMGPIDLILWLPLVARKTWNILARCNRITIDLGPRR